MWEAQTMKRIKLPYNYQVYFFIAVLIFCFIVVYFTEGKGYKTRFINKIERVIKLKR